MRSMSGQEAFYCDKNFHCFLIIKIYATPRFLYLSSDSSETSSYDIQWDVWTESHLLVPSLHLIEAFISSHHCLCCWLSYDEQKGFHRWRGKAQKLFLRSHIFLLNKSTERTKNVSGFYVNQRDFLLLETSSCLLTFSSSPSTALSPLPSNYFFPTHRILFVRRAETS